MQPALPVDWNAIRAAWLVGSLTRGQLASQFNVPYPTLKQRMLRERWTDLKANAVANTQTVTVKVQNKIEKPQSLALRDKAAKLLDNDIQVLEAEPPKSTAGVSRRQAALTAIVQNAKVIHGWGETEHNTLVSLSVLGTNAEPTAPALDVQSTEMPSIADAEQTIPTSQEASGSDEP